MIPEFQAYLQGLVDEIEKSKEGRESARERLDCASHGGEAFGGAHRAAQQKRGTVRPRLALRPVTPEVAGSSPVGPAKSSS